MRTLYCQPSRRSMYLEDGAYAHLDRSLVSATEFRRMHGENGLEKLWMEISSWTESPKRFFRNYSVEYMRDVIA